MEKEQEQQVIPPKESKQIDFDRCDSVEEQILLLLNTCKLNWNEIVYVLAMLFEDCGYTLDDQRENLDAEHMRRRYLSNPTMGLAMRVLANDILQDWLKLTIKQKTENRKGEK